MVPGAALVAEVEMESEEPISTYAERITGALSAISPCGQRPGVASPQGPSDDSVETDFSIGSVSSHESEPEQRVRGRGGVRGRARHGGGVSFARPQFQSWLL
jgi:hypothetical protein